MNLASHPETDPGLLRRIDAIPPKLAVAVAFMLVPVVGLLDYVTGEELSFAIFYLPLVLAVGWKANQWMVLIISLVCTTVWVVTNRMAAPHNMFALAPVWNSAVRLAYFLAFGLMSAKIKSMLTRERRQSRTDFLTGLGNSQAFVESAELEIERCKRYGTKLTIAYLDCDNFKAVNDSLGHAEGDRVLKAIGEVLKESLRMTDVAARLGGDEFAVLLPETAEQEVRPVIRRIREQLLAAMERQGWPVTFSIGVVSFETPPDSVPAMITRADNLMYSVKRRSKDDVAHQVVGTNTVHCA